MYFEIGLIVSLTVATAFFIHRGPFNLAKHFPEYWDLSGEVITLSDFLVIVVTSVLMIGAGVLVWPAAVILLILYIIWFYTFRIRNNRINK